MKRRLSLPREHGAWLTLGGAVLVGLALSHPGALASAVAIALSVAVAFLSRGPLEQRAIGRPAPHDGRALAALGAVTAASVLLAAATAGPAFAALALAIPLAGGLLSVAARRLKRHRDPIFELAAMTALGGSVFPIALAGGATVRTAAFPALVLAAHSAVAVPLVRTELRPGERAYRLRAELLSFVVLAGSAAFVALAGHPFLSLALAPRLIQVALRRVDAFQLRKPALVGVRETVLLVAAALIAVAAGRSV